MKKLYYVELESINYYDPARTEAKLAKDDLFAIGEVFELVQIGDDLFRTCPQEFVVAKPKGGSRYMTCEANNRVLTECFFDLEDCRPTKMEAFIAAYKRETNYLNDCTLGLTLIGKALRDRGELV